jgi:hypothetical protein
MSKENLELKLAELKAYGDKILAEFERQMNERIDASALVMHAQNEEFKKKVLPDLERITGIRTTTPESSDVLKRAKRLNADAILTAAMKMDTKN